MATSFRLADSYDSIENANFKCLLCFYCKKLMFFVFCRLNPLAKKIFDGILGAVSNRKIAKKRKDLRL